VIAVLLAVIGIAAVLMFWGMMSGFFNPQPKVIIEKATITKIGKDTYDVSITVRETGGASTQIKEAKIIVDGQENTLTLKTGDTTLSPGQSKTLIYSYSGVLQPGKTYYVAVYYTKGDSDERSDLYPVTVR
jgi:ABC-type antimicrobial peptide transport system permease subunit